MQNHQSTYFPNLNGVRFIASFSVLIHHTEQVKYLLGINNIYDWFLIKNMGKLGVGLFFTLSGFLITYLLLQEKNRKGDISTKNFYIRRILRIWPLYFIIVLLAFFVFPQFSIFNEPFNEHYIGTENYFSRLILFLCFLPNVGFVFFGSPYLCAQTWSIGIEEQFYAIWPWIIKSKKPVRTFIKVFVIIGLLTATLLAIITYSGWFSVEQQINIKSGVNLFFSQFRILTMVIGGLGAFLIFSNHKVLEQLLFRKDVQWGVYGILAIMLLTGLHVPLVNMEFYGLFFCFFIINVARNPQSIIYLEQRWVHYLGKISYGIYIYHPAIIILTVNTLHYFGGNKMELVTFNLILYPTVILLTILVCELSFRYVEQPLLKLKDKFS